MNTLTPPSVLLVGASSEIGHCITLALLADTPGVAVLAGRPSPRRTHVADDLQRHGHAVHVLDYDTADGEAATGALLHVAQRLAGVLDTVVVAVGTMAEPPHPPAGAGPSLASDRSRAVAEPDLHRVLTVNLVGPALVANAAADLLSAQGHGTLVVLTSAAAARPRQDILGYAAAKQALDTFVRGLEPRLRPHGVRCVVVRPGRVRTRMTKGLPDVPLTTGPELVASRVRSAIASTRTVVWSPRVLRSAVAVLNCIPVRALPARLR